jgi:hypothetical protein
MMQQTTFAGWDFVNTCDIEENVTYPFLREAGVSTGPVAHWKFDEGSGTTAYDSAGNNEGTVYGAQWTTGQVDGALDFDGVDDYVDMGDQTKLEGFSEVSIAAWIYWTGSVYNYFIAGKEGVYKIDVHWSHIRFVTGNDWAGTILTSSEPIQQNTWYHIAATYDGAIKHVYINGIKDENSVSTSSGGVGTNTKKFTIGVLHTGAWYYYFKGIIDEVAIYNRALSAEEIWQLYQRDLPVLVAIDIKPQSCPNPLNLKSRGVLPVAVLGSEDFDVNNIDVASIRLAEVAPIRSSFDDVATPVADGNECECITEGPDGYTDLTLKFKTQEIVEKLINAPNELVDSQPLSLTLTGASSDDTLIEGTDCVLLVGNVLRAIAAKRADINGDSVVDFRDLTIVSNYWLEFSEIE